MSAIRHKHALKRRQWTALHMQQHAWVGLLIYVAMKSSSGGCR